MKLTTDEMAKLTRLIAYDGQFDGRQIIPPAWIKAMKSRQIQAPTRVCPETGYGYYLWLRPNNDFYLSGIYGQIGCHFVAQDILFCCNGHVKDELRPLELLEEMVLPQLR